MGVLIKNIRNRNKIEFDKGLFDDWCVYLTRMDQPRYAPKDEMYFSLLYQLGHTHGHAKIYNDFIRYYNMTGREVDQKVLALIGTLADEYGHDAEEADIWFTVMYAGMVAEENKVNAILKKRMKRLGMHQVFMEGMPPAAAAVFSKGKKWKELDVLMKQRGF